MIFPLEKWAMSYDIHLQRGGMTVELPKGVEQPKGGTYTVESRGAWLNVTYNYAPFFYKHIDKEKGIRWLYGQKARDTINKLETAIEAMDPTTETRNYWEATEGNARLALVGLLRMAQALPDCE